jgi:predicted dehydrogenase
LKQKIEEADNLKVGIVGCGLQGWRRARAIREFGDEVVIVADANETQAAKLGSELKCSAVCNWEDIVNSSNVDAVVVCTPNNLHAPISIAAMTHDKHVLCEKPLATSVDDAKRMVELSRITGMKLKCGFNHRYHPGVQQAFRWMNEGAIGDVNFIRAVYGIGGRLDFDKEWRTNKIVSGGGQLMDQGLHVIDLSRWFIGEFTEAFGYLSTRLLPSPDIEDNAFCLLRNQKQQIASIHVSWTQWKNTFRFEVYGKLGYATIEGLGGSYDVERAILGLREINKPFKETIIEYRGNDVSWLEEWKDFSSAIKMNAEPLGNGYDGLQAIKVAHAVYDSMNTSSVTKLAN